MTVVVSRALVLFVLQGAALGVGLALTRSWWRRLEARARFMLLFAVLLLTPALVLWTMLQGVDAPGASGSPPRWAMLVAHGWLLGVGLCGTKTALELRAVHRLRATGLPLRSLHTRLQTLTSRLGISRPVALVESPAIRTPMVIGWIRPMILLPIGLVTRMPASWIDTILVHELAHIRRHDLALRMVQRVIETLLFFHPLIWWLGAQIDHAREEACDDIVVDRLRDPLGYARALTELEAMQHPPAALAAGASEGHLMKRIQHIMQRNSNRGGRVISRPFNRWWQAIAVTATMSITGYAVANVSAPVTEPVVDIEWMPDAVVDLAPEITEAARAHDLDPDLLAILVLLESRGNPNARSPRGARGLMQIMPETGDAIASARGLRAHDYDKLEQPAYNLDLGAWYFAQQLRHFADRTESTADAIAWAAAAYNGGPAAAEQAFEGTGTLSDETSRYQGLVAMLWAERRDPTSSLFE